MSAPLEPRVPRPPTDPWDLLRAWLPANDDPDRPTMTVATTDATGAPDARTQLLTEYGRDGFWLHTDARSRKVAQLAADPRVALVLHLADQLRQVVVRGVAEPAAVAELEWAYEARSSYLRLLAWLNTDELAARPYAERLATWAAFADSHDDLEPPPTWTGYLVRPVRLTFWQGDPDTASRRFEYTSPTGAPQGAGSTWEVSVLAG